MTRSGFFLSLLAALGLSLGAHAATRLSANAGEVRDIKWAAGNTVYAATQGGGVFKSSDAGATWSATSLTTGYVWRLAVSPLSSTRVYAATDAGLFRTSDGGTSWTQLTFDPARAVAVDPGSVTNDTVLLGVTGQGIFRSTDNGANWGRSGGLDSTEVTQIIFQSAGTAFAALDCNYQDLLGTFGEGGWGGVFRSTNGGVTWANYNNGGGGGTTIGTPPNCVRAIASNGSILFAGTYSPFGAAGGIYRSSGSGWTSPGGTPQTANLVGVEAISVDRNTGGIWGGARQIGPWLSVDNGANWTQKVTDLTNDRDAFTRVYAIETLSGVPNTVLIAAKGVGIQRSTNNGTSWTIATGLTADRVRGLANHAAAASTTYWMALENGGVKKSTTSGASWIPFFLGWDCSLCDVNLDARTIAADPSTTAQGSVLVGVRGDGIWKLNAATTGWDITGLPTSVTWQTGFDNKPQSIIMPTSNQIYYTAFDATGSAAGGLVRSTTGYAGLTQTVYPDVITSCGTPASASSGAYKVVQASGNVAYLIRYDGMPYRSTANFSGTAGCITAAHTGFSRLAFFDLAEKPSAASTLVGVTNKGVYRSTDTGVNWSRVSITGPAGMPQVLAAVAYVGSNVFAISRAGGLYCSADDGTTWQSVSLTGLPAVPFRDMKVINSTIHILTDGGGVFTGFAGSCP